MMSEVLDLSEVAVREIMVPRVEVPLFDIADPREKLVDVIRKERPKVGTADRTSRSENEGAFQGSAQPTRERLTRRPYDFFQDQVLWLNRTKVEIQERYDRRITANAMVQLALDLLITDYKRRKERSRLVTKLVLNQRTGERPSGRS